MTSYTILAAPPSDSGSGNPLGSPLLMMVLMVVIFYFLIIRPGQRQKKEQQARIASIEKCDKVITVGGLHGAVHHISDKTVTLKLAEGIFVPFEKSAIQSVNKIRSEDSSRNGDDKNDNKAAQQKPNKRH